MNERRERMSGDVTEKEERSYSRVMFCVRRKVGNVPEK
jgi:hypothetical protein